MSETFESKFQLKIRKELLRKLEKKLWGDIRTKVRNKSEAEFLRELGRQLWDDLHEKLWDALESELDNKRGELYEQKF